MWVSQVNYGLFALRYFRSRERKFSVGNIRSRGAKTQGTFASASFRSRELSFPRAKMIENFCSPIFFAPRWKGERSLLKCNFHVYNYSLLAPPTTWRQRWWKLFVILYKFSSDTNDIVVVLYYLFADSHEHVCLRCCSPARLRRHCLIPTLFAFSICSILKHANRT